MPLTAGLPPTASVLPVGVGDDELRKPDDGVDAVVGLFKGFRRRLDGPVAEPPAGFRPRREIPLREDSCLRG